MTHYTLLSTHPNIRRIWINQFLTAFGSWFSNVAIYTLLIGFGADAMTISLVAAMHLLPAVVQAPIAGPLIDKLAPRKVFRVLLVVEFLATAGFLLITDKELVGLLMLFVFVKMGAASFYFTTEMALMPKIVKGEALKLTNDLLAMTWSLTFVLGMALGGIVVHAFGTATAFVLDASMFVVAYGVLRGIVFPDHIPPEAARIGTMIRDGLSYMRRNTVLLRTIVLHASVGLTAFDALVTLLAKTQYAALVAVPLAIGWINAVRAVGLMLGPLVFGRIADKNRLLQWAFVGQGGGILLWAALQGSFYWAFVGLFATGLFTATIWSVTYSMLQEATDDVYHGRVIAYNDMVFMLSNVATSLAIGMLAQLGVALWLITVFLGCGFLLFALFYYFFRRDIISTPSK